MCSQILRELSFFWEQNQQLAEIDRTMLLEKQSHRLVVHTPAKLNLSLRILGKRADGYHELETFMVSVSLYDTLTFTEDESGEIGFRCESIRRNKSQQSSSDDHIPQGSENLVVKAAKLFQQHTGISQGLSISLKKRIPSAAGLGGGSSDAAATLVACNSLSETPLTLPELHNLAAQLGSDVNFFLAESTAAVCRGRGELISPVTLPMSLSFLIARPTSGLSTAEVFRQFSASRNHSTSAKTEQLLTFLQCGQLKQAAGQLQNDLQPAACELNTDIDQMAKEFGTLPVYGHQMSGSGTSYFGLCASFQQAKKLAARWKHSKDWEVFAVRTLC